LAQKRTMRIGLIFLTGFGFGSSTVANRLALAEIDPIGSAY
jgi:hypothetical protein